MQINKKQLETLFELNLSQKCIKLIDELDLNYSNLSQEDRDRHIQKCINWCMSNNVPYNKNYQSNNIFLGERTKSFKNFKR